MLAQARARACALVFLTRVSENTSIGPTRGISTLERMTNDHACQRSLITPPCLGHCTHEY